MNHMEEHKYVIQITCSILRDDDSSNEQQDRGFLYAFDEKKGSENFGPRNRTGPRALRSKSIVHSFAPLFIRSFDTGGIIPCAQVSSHT